MKTTYKYVIFNSLWCTTRAWFDLRNTSLCQSSKWSSVKRYKNAGYLMCAESFRMQEFSAFALCMLHGTIQWASFAGSKNHLNIIFHFFCDTLDSVAFVVSSNNNNCDCVLFCMCVVYNKFKYVGKAYVLRAPSLFHYFLVCYRIPIFPIIRSGIFCATLAIAIVIFDKMIHFGSSVHWTWISCNLQIVKIMKRVHQHLFKVKPTIAIVQMNRTSRKPKAAK